MSDGCPKRSIQARAARTISRRFAPVTASNGWPNDSPRRAFTSMKATSTPRRAMMSISIRPTRQRCASTSQPRLPRKRIASSSAATPCLCRWSVHSAGSLRRPRCTAGSYRLGLEGASPLTCERWPINAISDLRHQTSDLTSDVRCLNSVSTNLIQLLQPHQHVARLAAVGRTQDPGHFQLVDDAGGSAIADAHTTLQQRRRPELILDAHLSGLAEQRIPLARVLSAAAAAPGRLGGPDGRDLLPHRRPDLSGALGRLARAIPLHDALGLLGRDVGPLDAHRLALTRRQEQH